MDKRPFDAYRGTEPFIFVSYSHRDDESVYSELEHLNSLGFRCWYDEGIAPGKGWADEIAQRIGQCAIVIFFVTPNSSLSRHCANEIHYALELGKPVLTVELQPTRLPPGLTMQLGTAQGILKYQLSESRYVAKLEAAIKEFLEAETERSRTTALPKLPMGLVTMMRVQLAAPRSAASASNEEIVQTSLRLQSTTREAGHRFGGFEIDSGAEIAFFAFKNSLDAVLAAIETQQAWAKDQPEGTELPGVRIALHTGQPSLVDNKYFGVDVLRIAQIATIGSSGQIILSSETRDAIHERDLPKGVELRELGLHRIKDLPYPEMLHDLAIPGLTSDFTPIASLTNRPTNLPSVLTKFVGRKRELRDIYQLLRDEDVRLLTLTGPGGTGKTRLSFESAKTLEQEFEDGVFAVLLAATTDPNLVIATIAETLGVVVLPTRSPMESLVKYLAPLNVLLVLDNFEQVVEGAASLLELLESCPRVKIIVTSREPLELRPERTYAVRPLELPEPDPNARRVPLEKIEATELFVERVRDHVPNFALNADNEEAIARICITLEGLPLALELAASRMSVLTPLGLLENLETSFDILKARSRDIPERQRTLQNTVNWSFRLLSERERSLFIVLSVFRGGFSLRAAQFVAAGEFSEVDVIDYIESLTRKSLLNRDPSHVEPRYWMLETIRQFGSKRLAADADHERVSARHCEYFLALAESLAPGLTAHQQRHSITQLIGDADNLRAGLGWAVSSHNAGAVSRYLRALLWLWIPRGYFAEGKQWVARALNAIQDPESRHEVALIREVGAWLDTIGGGYADAAPKLERALSELGESGNAYDIARIKSSLGMTKTVLGLPGGMELAHEAWEFFEHGDDDYWIGLTLITLGTAQFVKGDIGAALAQWEKALEIFRSIGNTFWTCRMLLTIAFVRLQASDWQVPARLLREAMNIGREYEYPLVIHEGVSLWGNAAVIRGLPVEAAKFFGFVQASCARLGISLEPIPLQVMNANLEKTRQQLSAKDFRDAFDQGANWKEQEVLAAASQIFG